MYVFFISKYPNVAYVYWDMNSKINTFAPVKNTSTKYSKLPNTDNLSF